MQRHASPAFSFALALAAACTLSLSACQNPDIPQTNKPIIAINERPDPQQAYRIVMTIDNAPGPFAMIEGSAQYDVVNHNECGYIDPGAETISRINTHPPIKWKPIGEGQYEATVYADLMLDEDYYGRGLCRWAFTEARARLKATGAQAETRFVASISVENILSEKFTKLYFWGGYYPSAKSQNFPDFGEDQISDVTDDQKGEFFTITMTPKDAPP